MTDHVSALVAAGVPRGRAEDLVDAEVVTEVGGTVLVAAELTEPLSGEQQVVVPLGGVAVLADPAAFAELRALARRTYPAATSLVLRLPWTVRPPAGVGARLLMRYVEASRPTADAPPPSGWTVRPYDPSVREEVRDLLLRALDTGYRTIGRPVSPGRAEGLVADLLGRVGGDVIVYCAFTDDRFAGHSVIVWDEDDVTGSPRPELFDVFVLPEHRGSPAGRLLVAAALRWAAAAGHPLRGHVVGDDDNAETVVDRLLGQGWRPAEAYWAVPLRSS